MGGDDGVAAGWAIWMGLPILPIVPHLRYATESSCGTILGSSWARIGENGVGMECADGQDAIGGGT
jgi:hypothetical protein